MISANMGLTVAHNVFNTRKGIHYKKFKFYPGLNGKKDNAFSI